jgi:predicted ATPase/class 3 adenylate cyclase
MIRAAMRHDLPSGTVTFLFTDVEGSTRLLDSVGAEGYADALAEHRRVIRDACAPEGGVEVDTQGDAFFFAFPTAPGALRAAEALTGALASGAIRVRVGVHTGTPLLTEEGYVGPDLHRAARIAAAGHGGQVLVSSSTATLAEPGLTDLGEHRFKDLAAPERVFQLGTGSFPPLRSLYRTNLPVPANPLIGRKKELVDLLRALADDTARVVTITGAGGIGKTRLAIAAAAEASDDFPNGVWFVDLSPVRDPALVVPTAAHAMGADGELTHYVRDDRCLLLLDNFEQVVDAASEIARVVAACPNVRVLATSREALRIAAEREYALPPLPESPAVELFRQRTAAAVPEAEVEYDVAAEICRRLDRLPLAIELAAARARVFEPDVLLERLEERLPMLATRARDLPERQQTLRATIAWSYELLTRQEQVLFGHLAVFRGGATLEAIEVVTGADAELVESLVDKSLLRRRRGRFVMLETIREFARDELEVSGEADDVRRRHGDHFVVVAEFANLNAGKLRAGGQRLDVAIAEQDNIRAALSWAIAAGSLELALRLATAMEQFWVVNDPHEGKRWFRAIFERAEGESDVDPLLRAHALRAFGSCADVSGDFELAEDLYTRSLALHTELGDERGRAVSLHRVGIIAMRAGELDQARALVEESQEIHERNGDTWGLAQTRGTLGAISRDDGHAHRAYPLIEESAELAAQVGVVWWQAGMLMELAALSLEAARIEDAESKARQSLSIAQQMRDYGGRVFGVGVLACVAAERGDAGLAGRLWGAIEDDRVGAPLGGWIRHRAACQVHIDKCTGSELQAALASGRELSLDSAVELALADA